MDPLDDHHAHYQHQSGQMNMLPNGAATHTDMGMMMGEMHHHSGSDHQMDGMQGMMKMYFHYGLGDLVLFKGLVIDSNATLALTCFVLFLSGILLEFIDYSRGYLSCRCRTIANQGKSLSESRLIGGQQRNGAQQEQSWSCCSGTVAPQENDHLSSGQGRRRNNESGNEPQFQAQFFPVRSPDPLSYRLLQACLQFVRTGLSLMLMLVAMTYNICLIFPILLGSAVGYFIFYRPALDSKSVVCH